MNERQATRAILSGILVPNPSPLTTETHSGNGRLPAQIVLNVCLRRRQHFRGYVPGFSVLGELASRLIIPLGSKSARKYNSATERLSRFGHLIQETCP